MSNSIIIAGLIGQLVFFAIALREAILKVEPGVFLLTLFWTLPTILALGFVLTH